MILYLPSGTHLPGSLPCVMIAAAGTTLLEGNGCYDESYQSETIPYVQQGFAVLGYSLDGPLASDKPSNQEVAVAYEQFRAAHAGLVNARNALEFVLQKVPVINRDRIFTAGHSSAGTLSLLFAEHENRLAGCIAYAPCVDVENRLSEYVSNPRVAPLLPEIGAFLRQESPLRHVKSLKCPVFLFHAEADSNAPFSESQELAARLTAQGTPCQLETVPDGDHYDSMLEEGIPRSIDWLRKLAQPEHAQPSVP
jgi:dienelactone hydrolase